VAALSGLFSPGVLWLTQWTLAPVTQAQEPQGDGMSDNTVSESKASALLVDDTPDNIDLLVNILKHDYRVKAAINGEQALKIVAQTSPDIILLDVMMPGIDGFEVCRRLKADYTTRHIPVIFITAMIGMDDELKGLELDADEWEIMKTHAEIGAMILGDDPSDLMSMAREVAITHHEKWDGSGYPRGVADEAIPRIGRIVAIADVFDAKDDMLDIRDRYA